ncbi:MAG TPA: hypothetical protein VGZ33_04380 [Acidimicrobiales bacterium]|nr:hypothetical protein [Acidimicrobiales bacterium]
MADEGRGIAKPALGVIGAVAAIASIWWFALRPRRHRDDAPGE